MINQAAATIKLRRDTASSWTLVNPVLSAGEPGLETDTRLIKYGDGITPWNDLDYSAIVPTAVAAPVSSIAPEVAMPGMLWFDSAMDQMKVYSESTDSWQPIAPKSVRYSFSESSGWLVEHNRNTTAFTVSLTDSEGDMFYAKTRVIDNNSFLIVLTSAVSGVADVTFI